jgi:hypothetical protein
MPERFGLPLICNVMVQDQSLFPNARFETLNDGRIIFRVIGGHDDESELVHGVGKVAREMLIVADFHHRLAVLFDEMFEVWMSLGFQQDSEHFSYDHDKRLLLPRREYLQKVFLGPNLAIMERADNLAFDVLSIGLDSPIKSKSRVYSTLSAALLSMRLLIPTGQQINTVLLTAGVPLAVEVIHDKSQERLQFQQRFYSELENGRKARDYRALQRSLRELGQDPGPIDGIVGKRTLAAIENYVMEHRLPSKIDPDDDSLLASIASEEASRVMPEFRL